MNENHVIDITLLKSFFSAGLAAERTGADSEREAERSDAAAEETAAPREPLGGHAEPQEAGGQTRPRPASRHPAQAAQETPVQGRGERQAGWETPRPTRACVVHACWW